MESISTDMSFDESISTDMSFDILSMFNMFHSLLYVVGSAIGFVIFTTVLSAWALTFAIGGENLFGSVWDDLVMYNVAEKLGLVGWT
ncbi:Gamma-secretase aspartyl protease complex, presenilin enhancer-2 subunit [Dillenia turbinata]|uniref:Gamma-secretase aspartyl protease complex, presenilin enhancer-2 subunit n=1 Tax=Dillenia turbinata TaxID=194707 RepID=A0AAN8Z4Z3_9MAGN